MLVLGWGCLWLPPFVWGEVVVDLVGGVLVFVEAEYVVAGVVALFPFVFFLFAHWDSVVC